MCFSNDGVTGRIGKPMHERSWQLTSADGSKTCTHSSRTPKQRLAGQDDIIVLDENAPVTVTTRRRDGKNGPWT